MEFENSRTDLKVSAVTAGPASKYVFRSVSCEWAKKLYEYRIKLNAETRGIPSSCLDNHELRDDIREKMKSFNVSTTLCWPSETLCLVDLSSLYLDTYFLKLKAFFHFLLNMSCASCLGNANIVFPDLLLFFVGFDFSSLSRFATPLS